ncbi:MAG: hypothetical protein LBC87_12180 [Fibromonadaceae bacterium]|jgi:hypothetical protein|nr:hypothetical protein [Fibromonadaceae bacterium]
MARPIAETPILTGNDARRFDRAMKNLKPAPKKEILAQRKAYELAKQRATFLMP